MSDFPVLNERQFGALKVQRRAYGMDYFWRDNYFLTSGHYYIHLKLRGKKLSFMCQFPRAIGMQINGRTLFYKYWKSQLR